MKKNLFTIIAIILIIAMETCTVFANADNTVKKSMNNVEMGAVKIIDHENNTYTLIEPAGISTIKVLENSSNVTIQVFDNVLGEDYYFLRDTKTGTVYSSLTGKTIALDSAYDSLMLKADTLSQDKWTKKVSYKTMASALGTATSYAALIAWAMSFVGFSVVAANVATGISGMMLLINTYLPEKSSKHGLKFTLHHKKIKKHQGGKVVYVTVTEACGCTTY